MARVFTISAAGDELGTAVAVFTLAVTAGEKAADVTVHPQIGDKPTYRVEPNSTIGFHLEAGATLSISEIDPVAEEPET
jgi:hypothetical protein